MQTQGAIVAAKSSNRGGRAKVDNASPKDVLIETIRKTLQEQPDAAARLTWLARLKVGTLERLQAGEASSFSHARLRTIYEHLRGQAHGAHGRFDTKVTAVKRDFQVNIAPDVADRLRAYGAGNLSAAIASATVLVRDRQGAHAVLPEPPRGSYPHKGGEGVAGRKRLGPDARRRTCVKLLPAVADQLRIFGAGNLSAGIERVSLAVAETAATHIS